MQTLVKLLGGGDADGYQSQIIGGDKSPPGFGTPAGKMLYNKLSNFFSQFNSKLVWSDKVLVLGGIRLSKNFSKTLVLLYVDDCSSVLCN